jgi:biopolymer transport protein ExbB
VAEQALELLMTPYLAVTELIEGGGPFVTWIFLSCLVLWALVIERFLYFSRVLPRESAELLERWRARTDHKSWCARQIRAAMISRLKVGMTANLRLMKVLVPLSPLLGLIGTVSGMLEVFDSMALRGSADARTMASGVSHAMICTLTGLAVSISGLYPVHYFDSRARRQTELLADAFEY